MSGPWDDYKDSKSDNSGPWNDYSEDSTGSPKEKSSSTPQSAIDKAFGQTNAMGLFLPRHPVDDIADIEQGAIEAPASFGQNIIRAVTSVMPKSLQNNSYVKAINNEDWDKETSGIGSGNNDLSSNLLRGAGQFALPGSAEEETSAKIAELLPEALKGGSSILGRMISGGIGGLSSATQNANQTPDDALRAAIINAIVPTAIEGGANTLEKMRPSKALRGTLSPKQLEENLEQTHGTSTGLGSVIGHKKLKDTLEVKAPQYVGTGANEAMQQTAQQIESQGKDLMSQMLGDTQPSDVPNELKTGLQKADKEVNATSKKKANALNDAADTAGIAAGDTNLAKEAKTILEEIKRSPKLARKVPESVKDDLKIYASSNDEDSLKDADIFKGTLNDDAKELFKSGKKYQAGIYGRLRDAKQKDIDDALEKTTDSNVSQLRDEYRKHFKEEKVPFEDKDVTKFTRKAGDPDLFLKTFLKTGNTDRPVQLEKVMGKLPVNKKDLMAYAHYAPAIDENGVVNPQKLATLHGRLSPNQKSVLFNHNPELGKAMDKYAGLVGKNKKALNTMFIPETGAKLAAFAPTATASAGMSIGASIAGVPGAIVGAAVGATAPSIAGKIATKILTSEKVRNALVKAMLENKPKFKAGGPTTKALQVGAQSVSNSRGAQ